MQLFTETVNCVSNFLCSGELRIRTGAEAGKSNCSLYMEYGVWGRGCLEGRKESPSSFSLELETDILQIAYAEGKKDANARIDFGQRGRATLAMFGFSVEFLKNVTLKTLPVIPWRPDSCGPEPKEDLSVIPQVHYINTSNRNKTTTFPVKKYPAKKFPEKNSLERVPSKRFTRKSSPERVPSK
jgi:hypothetical protein